MVGGSDDVVDGTTSSAAWRGVAIRPWVVVDVVVSQLKTSNSDSSDPRSASLTSITAADRFTNHTPTLCLLHVSIRSLFIITHESNRLRNRKRRKRENLES
nr:hypothetical protein CFP56_49875 [Quercus suber]